VKVVYCGACKDISIKSRREEDTCNTCGREARPVSYRRPWQYYAGSVVLVAATILLILLPIPDFFIRLAILGVAVAIAIVFSTWSIAAIRASILRTANEAEQREAKA